MADEQVKSHDLSILTPEGQEFGDLAGLDRGVRLVYCGIPKGEPPVGNKDLRYLDFAVEGPRAQYQWAGGKLEGIYSCRLLELHAETRASMGEEALEMQLYGTLLPNVGENEDVDYSLVKLQFYGQIPGVGIVRGSLEEGDKLSVHAKSRTFLIGSDGVVIAEGGRTGYDLFALSDKQVQDVLGNVNETVGWCRTLIAQAQALEAEGTTSA